MTNDVDTVRKIMARGGWLTPWEIQRKLSDLGRRRSGSSVTARMRDLRKLRYGGYRIRRRKRASLKHVFEYAMDRR